MREIGAEQISSVVASLFEQACCALAPDVEAALRAARDRERSQTGRRVLDDLIANAQVSAAQCLPLCQDTGLAVIFVDVGQEVHLVGGSWEEAIQQGVRTAYARRLLRMSCVRDPAGARVNTQDNTPAVIHYRAIPGDRVRLVALAKGAGAENKSVLAMLEPSRGRSGVISTVEEAVRAGGASACPPLIVGVGIGGNFELAPLLAKRALLRGLGSSHPDPRVSDLEDELEGACNRLGIGPMGLGGVVTVLDVFVEEAPCHIASLPVAVNLQCHSQRHREAWV